MKPRMQLYGNQHTISSSDLPKLLRTSVKPVHGQYLSTGLTEVLDDFGRPGDDMF